MTNKDLEKLEDLHSTLTDVLIERVKSGEKMRKPGSKGAPTAANFRRAAKTAKKR